jgi:hypothetical protein
MGYSAPIDLQDWIEQGSEGRIILWAKISRDVERGQHNLAAVLQLLTYELVQPVRRPHSA